MDISKVKEVIKRASGSRYNAWEVSKCTDARIVLRVEGAKYIIDVKDVEDDKIIRLRKNGVTIYSEGYDGWTDSLVSDVVLYFVYRAVLCHYLSE